MKRQNKWIYIIGCIALTVIVICCYIIAVRKSKQEKYDSAIKAMVYITNQDQGGNGSIYKIEDDRLVIVTTYHLVQDSDTVMIYLPDQSIFQGEVLLVNKEHDVGFVTVDMEQVSEETLEQIDYVRFDEKTFDKLQTGDYMEYRYLEWNGGHVSSTTSEGNIGHMNWYIEDFDDYFVYNYCDVEAGMSGCAAVAEDGSYIGMMIGGAINESGALSVKTIEEIYAGIE